MYDIIPLDQVYYKYDNTLITENKESLSSMNLFIFFGTSYFQSVVFEPENMLKQTVGNTADIFLPVGYQKLRHFQDNIVSLGKNFIDKFIKYRDTKSCL